MHELANPSPGWKTLLLSLLVHKLFTKSQSQIKKLLQVSVLATMAIGGDGGDGSDIDNFDDEDNGMVRCI